VNTDVITTQLAVRCADGRIHYGPDYLRGEDPQRVKAIADAHSEETWCGGGPHTIVTRQSILTRWVAA
jgi:hypothetical protein